MKSMCFRFLPRLLCIFSFALGIFSHISCDVDSSSSPAPSTGADNVRTIDGTENNLGDPFMGSAGIQLRRIAEPAYNDRVSAPADDGRPHPRDVSNAVVAQNVSIPNDRGLSSMVWQWGQYLDHDISLTPQHEPFEDYSIVLPIGDEIFDPERSGTVTMPMGRSVYDESTGTDPSNPRQQMNMITSWIDGSAVYGSDEERALWLRSGVGGKLKMSEGDLLPFNDGSQDNAGGSSTNLFVAGDVRANEQIGLTAMHTLFVREHNRLCDEIKAENPEWTDEEIYQRARKIVGAIIQAITFNEFLPALLGEASFPEYNGYNPELDASISNEFSTALYRFGHSMLTSLILRLDSDGNEIPEGHLALRDAFFSPERVLHEGGIEPILRGLATQHMEEVDTRLVDEVRNFLFGPPGAGGFDLACLNIQRGRDHGLPDYNNLRIAFGLEPVQSFSEITSNDELARALEDIYGSVRVLDPWIGSLAENHLPGSSVGELIRTGLVDQFIRLRDGDRFFYRNYEVLSSEDIAMIERSTLAEVIRRNTGISDVQDNVFFVE